MLGAKTCLFPPTYYTVMSFFIFFKGTISNIQALTSLFSIYARALNQVFCTTKSTLFASIISSFMLNSLLIIIVFLQIIHVFHLSWMPIFKGRVKSKHLQHIVGKP